MFHLVQDNVERVQNNLLSVKSFRDSVFSWWFNAVLLVLVVGSFGFFLYSSHGTAPEEPKKIPFTANPWLNAVRNVPTNDYGQSPQIETGSGVQGRIDRTSASTF
jgi:hypothetical protein